MKKIKFISLCMAVFLTTVACKNDNKKTDNNDDNIIENTENGVEINKVSDQDQDTDDNPIVKTTTSVLDTKTIGKVTVQLIEVNSTGKVMNINLLVERNGNYDIQRIPLDKINIIDDATAQKYDLLKDDAGNYMASPIDNYDGSELKLALGNKEPVIVDFKFPALPDGSTFTLTVPGLVTFNGVKVQ